MQKLLKAYVGIALALSVAFHGIFIQHYSERHHFKKLTKDDDQKVSFAIISDLTSPSTVFSEGESLTSSFPKNNFSFGDFLAVPPTWYLFHFTNEIRKKVLLQQGVELFFGIRDLKFPSHFFW